MNCNFTMIDVWLKWRWGIDNWVGGQLVNNEWRSGNIYININININTKWDGCQTPISFSVDGRFWLSIL